MNLKTYYSDTTVLFGKYEGSTIDEILEFDPLYIDWCINNLEHFAIYDDVVGKLKEKSDIFVDIDATIALNENKIEDYQSNLDSYYEDRRFREDLAEWNRGAFDGFNDAYWNID